MLDNFDANSDNSKRQLYVAMTRAKQNLIIHYNGSFLYNIEVEELTHIKNMGIHPLPKHLMYHLTHKDINLGYFDFIQGRLNSLKSGDALEINEKGLMNLHGEQIVKFSQTFQTRRIALEKQGYRLVESKIRFILYWRNHNEIVENKKEIKIVLPELYFENE
jgi:ATP-dependent DNA helicase RecQ